MTIVDIPLRPGRADNDASERAGALGRGIARFVLGPGWRPKGQSAAARRRRTRKGPRLERIGDMDLTQPLLAADTRSRAVPARPQQLDIARRNFARSMDAVGLYVLSIAWAPIIIPATAIALTIVHGHTRMTINKMRKERKFTIDSLLMTMHGGLILVGWWSTFCLIAGIISTSRYLLLKTEDQSRQKLYGHFADLPATVWVVTDGVEVQVPLGEVRHGDRVMVRAGEHVPIDGFVVEGLAEVDEASLTGEQLPVRKAAGDRVLATTMMLEGSAVVEVERSGDETAAAQVYSALARTADYKLEVQTRGEAHANAWAVPMFVAGLVSLPFVGPSGMLSVWVSVPGLNYRIVAPFAMLKSLSEAQSAHMMIKDGRVLEALCEIDTVVFDKTGTLTEDALSVRKAAFTGAIPDERLWHLIASAEHRQSHPIARALVGAARAAGIEGEAPSVATVVVGSGVRAIVGGTGVAIGNLDMMRSLRIRAVEPPEEEVPVGATVIHVAVDGTYCGHVVVEARVRPEAAEVIAELAACGIETAIISGDTERVTAEVAERLGVARHHADVLPHEKAAIIEAMQAEGRRVCFVGDGVNDAVALRQANVSMSLRGASTIAVDTAHIVLLQPDMRLVTQALRMVKSYDRRMRWSKWMVVAPAFVSWAAIAGASVGPLFPVVLSQTFLWTSIAVIAGTRLDATRALPAPEAHTAEGGEAPERAPSSAAAAA